MNIHLHFFDKGQWTHSGNTYLRGNNIIKDHTRANDQTLAGLIQEVSDLESACKLNNRLNGLFAWIMSDSKRVFLSADHHRSVPLFYAVRGDEVWISDRTDWIYRRLPRAMPDDLLASEYLVLGYITGKETLCRDIFQVEAGTVVEVSLKQDHADSKQPSIRSKRYFRYVHQYRKASRKQFLHDFDDIVLQTMQRVTEYAAGRPIVVPLSGGYDSRLIAITLSRLEYPDVCCYTYGLQGSKEARISQTIAEKLNFPWTKVHYTQKKWREWFHNPKRRLYYRQASGLAGIPNIQELVALGELKNNHLLPGDAVIVGGHHAMFAGGKGIYDRYAYHDHPEVKEKTIIKHILHYHYYLWNWSHQHDTLYPFFRQRILNRLASLQTYPDSPSACESWDYHERQAKFIIHAGRLYDFFGYDWQMPFCDMDYLHFWLEVPLAYRHDKSLYKQYINSFSPFEIPGYNPQKMVLSLREKIRNTPVFLPAQRGYQKYIQWNRRKNEYHQHPMGWYGIINKADFQGRFTGKENINSFQSLELLRSIFENGFLSVDEVLNRSAVVLQNDPIH
ncbi:MAG: asparagine synthase C-terminal domain-containing protein [Balneolales bacterium]